MKPEELIQFVKLNKRHGIIKAVSERTGISMPTVSKYLRGDIYNKTAIEVIKAAKEVIDASL
jgi:hypothetical protein